VGKPFRFVAKFDVANACYESENIFDAVHDLAKIPFVASYAVHVHEESPIIDCENILLNPLDH